jgi:hypothetical protein
LNTSLYSLGVRAYTVSRNLTSHSTTLHNRGFNHHLHKSIKSDDRDEAIVIFLLFSGDCLLFPFALCVGGSEVQRGQSCFYAEWTAVYTTRRKVVVICLHSTSTKIYYAFVSHKPEDPKTNDIENCSSFQLSNTSLVIHSSDSLLN